MSAIRKITSGIFYLPNFVAEPGAALAEVMEQVKFVQRTRQMYGKLVKTPRLEAWHGAHSYRFGGSVLPPRKLPPVVSSLGIRAEQMFNFPKPLPTFDSCLVNLYRDGSDTVGWHADDDDPEMPDPIIVSVSLGAERDFKLRRKRKIFGPLTTSLGPDAHTLRLEHGSALVMARGVQTEWEHSLPRRKRCSAPRVNLTYRAA